MSFVIAIDGPAGAGKGTLSQRLAAVLPLDVLDTGLLYRTIGKQILDLQGDPNDAQLSTVLAERLQAVDVLDDPSLRHERVGQAASICSGHPGVRAALLAFQQRFAYQPPSGYGAILDGRDIGTAVCPDADLKIWITARPIVRAQRRHAMEVALHGSAAPSIDDIAASIEARDERERNRPISPLKPAPDAFLLDTSDLSADEVFARVMNHLKTLPSFATLERQALQGLTQNDVDEPPRSPRPR